MALVDAAVRAVSFTPAAEAGQSPRPQAEAAGPSLDLVEGSGPDHLLDDRLWPLCHHVVLFYLNERPDENEEMYTSNRFKVHEELCLYYRIQFETKTIYILRFK